MARGRASLSLVVYLHRSTSSLRSLGSVHSSVFSIVFFLLLVVSFHLHLAAVRVNRSAPLWKSTVSLLDTLSKRDSDSKEVCVRFSASSDTELGKASTTLSL